MLKISLPEGFLDLNKPMLQSFQTYISTQKVSIEKDVPSTHCKFTRKIKKKNMTLNIFLKTVAPAQQQLQADPQE